MIPYQWSFELWRWALCVALRLDESSQSTSEMKQEFLDSIVDAILCKHPCRDHYKQRLAEYKEALAVRGEAEAESNVFDWLLDVQIDVAKECAQDHANEKVYQQKKVIRSKSFYRHLPPCVFWRCFATFWFAWINHQEKHDKKTKTSLYEFIYKHRVLLGLPIKNEDAWKPDLKSSLSILVAVEIQRGSK